MLSLSCPISLITEATSSRRMPEVLQMLSLCVAVVAVSIASIVEDDFIPCEYPSHIIDINYWNFHDYDNKRIGLRKISEDENGQKIRTDYYVRTKNTQELVETKRSVCVWMAAPDPVLNYYLMVTNNTYDCVRIYAQPGIDTMVYRSVPAVLYSCSFEDENSQFTMCGASHAQTSLFAMRSARVDERYKGDEGYLDTAYFFHMRPGIVAPAYWDLFAFKIRYSGSSCVRFAYRLPSDSNDSIRLATSYVAKHRFYWHRNGSTGLDEWIMEFVNITGPAYDVIFFMHLDNSHGIGIGLDEITVTSEPCPTVFLNCVFGIDGICELEHTSTRAQWKLQSGPGPDFSVDGPSTGPPGGCGGGLSYLIMVGSLDMEENVVRIQTPGLRHLGMFCVRFCYYMHGRDVNELGLYIKDPSIEKFLWRQRGEVGSKWQVVRRWSKSNYTSTVVGFQGKVGEGRYDDIAIDEILIFFGGCAPGPWHIQTCPNKNYEGNALAINVRWWDIADDVFNFKLERPCPFTQGKYHVSVGKNGRCEYIHHTLEGDCNNDMFSYAVMSRTTIELHTCLPGSSYENPHRNITLYCFGELPVNSIGSGFGRVLILGLKDEEFHAKFYVGRFEVNKDKEIQISLQGDGSGKLSTWPTWNVNSHCTSGFVYRHFSFTFHMQYIDYCMNISCNDHGTCTELDTDYVCNCDAGFTGKDCETTIIDCEEIDCTGHGDCVDSTSGYQCVCQSNYTGRQCEISTLVVTIEGYTGPITKGKSLNLTCHTNVQGKAMYMWLIRIQGSNSSVAISQNQTYRVSQVTTSDAGEYMCVVDTGSNSAKASVEVEVLTSGEAQAIKTEAAQYVPIAGISGALFVIFIVVSLFIVKRFHRSRSVVNKVDYEVDYFKHEKTAAQGREATPIDF